MEVVLASKFKCDKRTSLGLPVLPDVVNNIANSSLTQVDNEDTVLQMVVLSFFKDFLYPSISNLSLHPQYEWEEIFLLYQ